MLIYGSRATHAGDFQLKDVPCDNCGETSSFHMSFFARHGYLYWIPFIPIGKVSVAECNNCKRTFAEEEYNPTLSACRDELRGRVKAPIWNWAGLMIIGAILLGSSMYDTFRYHDPREALLNADIDMMTVSPSETSDSVSFKMKTFMDFVLHEDMTPEDIQYYTKVEDNKALVLVKVPDFDDVELNERPEMINLMQSIVEGQEDLEGMDKYYCVLSGGNQIMLARSPQDSSYGAFASGDILYDFYGPVQE